MAFSMRHSKRMRWFLSALAQDFLDRVQPVFRTRRFVQEHVHRQVALVGCKALGFIIGRKLGLDFHRTLSFPPPSREAIASPNVFTASAAQWVWFGGRPSRAASRSSAVTCCASSRDIPVTIVASISPAAIVASIRRELDCWDPPILDTQIKRYQVATLAVCVSIAIGLLHCPLVLREQRSPESFG